MPFAVSTHQMSTTPNMWTPNPIFWVHEIQLIYPVRNREIDKFSGKIYFFKTEQKCRRYHRKKIPWPTQTHEKHCSYRFVLCPSCPDVRRLGVRDSACSMAPASVTEFLGAEVWIWFFFHKIWNIKAKFSQYCTKLTNIYTPMSFTYRTCNAETA